jgi:drug/metabolite transporter (DMT)-like permease
MFVLGLVAALVSSAMFNVGAALQAIEARVQPKRLELRLGLLTRLLRRKLWLIGFALGLLGVVPQIVAFAYAPFVVVQPALVVGLLLLLPIGARRLGESVTALSWIGCAAIIGGVALVAAGAPTHSETHRGWVPVVTVVAGLTVPSVLPFAVRRSRWDGAWLVMIACGTGFAATNVATKLMSDDVGHSRWAQAAAWAVVALALGVVATLTGMTAFQRAAATVVVPLTTAVQTFLPIVLEPVFLREHFGSSLPITLGLIVTALGIGLVSRTRAVSGLLAAASR